MRKIYKYKLDVDDEQILILPKKSTILTVQTVDDTPYIWAEIDTIINETEERHILTFGTGNPIPDIEMEYIGTYQMFSGNAVFHVYESIE